jgi:hypothetical protein
MKEKQVPGDGKQKDNWIFFLPSPGTCHPLPFSSVRLAVPAVDGARGASV